MPYPHHQPSALTVMKIPTSSSIFLATLAISPSSSCLAAPTGDSPHDTGISSSSSNSHVSSLYGASAAHDHPSMDSNFDKREGLLCDDPTNPVLGVVCHILKGLDVQNGSQPIDPQDMEALQAASEEVSRVYNQSSIPAPSSGPATPPTAPATPGAPPAVGDPAAGVIQGPAQGLPQKALSDGDPNAGPGSSTASFANAGSNASSSPAIAAPTPPVSPPMPPNPPNTPQPPVSGPTLPV